MPSLNRNCSAVQFLRLVGAALSRQFLVLLILAGWILLIGCDGPKVVWSADSRSPDGKMIAHACTVQASGIGTGDPGTFVELNWTTGSQSPTVILAFHDGPNMPSSMNVEMIWLSPTHLEISYKGRRDLDFQAVKYHGVDISVRDVSSAMNNH